MMTKEKSYPQLLFARATDRQRSFLRRSAWMLGYILLGIAGILCAMLWGLVKEVFLDWTTPRKQSEPEPEEPEVPVPWSCSTANLHYDLQAIEALREGKVVFEYDPHKPFTDQA